MAFLMPNAHSVCALWSAETTAIAVAEAGFEAGAGRGRSSRMGETYVFLTQCETVLHRLLCVLIERFAL